MVERICSNCQVPLENGGEVKFRIGGYAGGKGWFLGSWNQLAEDVKPFTVSHCAKCGTVELYEPGVGD